MLHCRFECVQTRSGATDRMLTEERKTRQIRDHHVWNIIWHFNVISPMYASHERKHIHARARIPNKWYQIEPFAFGILLLLDDNKCVDGLASFEFHVMEQSYLCAQVKMSVLLIISQCKIQVGAECDTNTRRLLHACRSSIHSNVSLSIGILW